MPTPPVTLLRLLALALLASALVWLAPSSASAACSCTPAVIRADTERLARNANVVFTGTVEGSTADRPDDGTATAVFTADVAVELVFKGNLREPRVQVETVRGTSDCDLGRLEAGRRYAFFVERADGAFAAEGCGGTQPSRPVLLVELEELYGAGAPPPVEVPAETAIIEQVADVEDPPTFTRAAAPGGAMVLVGLLGLVVVRRLARR